MDVLRSDGLVENSALMGAYLRKRLLELQDGHQIIGDVRGLGLMQAIDLVKSLKTKEHAVKERDKVIELCYKRGLILLPAGRSAIRLIPPLIVDEGMIDEAIEILGSALRDMAR